MGAKMKIKYLLLILLMASWLQVSFAGLSPLNIDETNVDTFLPTPTFSDELYQLRRSYQPFGDLPSISFDSSVLQAGMGSVRMTQVEINGGNYWIDFVMNFSPEGLALEISDFGTGLPPSFFPWFPELFDLGIIMDFSMASADISGPPARIRVFDVGIDFRLYDLDFTLGANSVFVLSNIVEKNFSVLFVTPDDDGYITYASNTDLYYAEGSEQNHLSLPEAVFQSPMAMDWDGEDGEQKVLVNYSTGSLLQTMMATDGTLLGTYSPPKSVTRTSNAMKKSIFGGYFTTPTKDEELNACIDNKTKLLVGFKTENKLSQQLVDMVFTIAGHSSLKLSNSTLEKIRGTIADSKDVVLDMMANGKVDSNTLGIFVSTTLLKNLTPEEQQTLINQIWDNNVPGDIKTLATSAGAAETNYKLAAQALAEGLASKFFPAYTAAVKTVQESVKYAKDALSNDAFQELYKVYKDNGGNWNDVITLSPLATNKFADSKVREILKAQGKLRDNNSQANRDFNFKAIDNYLKNKMETLYANEPKMAEEKEKLNRAKNNFLNLQSWHLDTMKKTMGKENPSYCDLFNKYLDHVARAQQDLIFSSRDCSDSGLKPDKSAIEARAHLMARIWLRDISRTERKNIYQKSKLDWLKSKKCLNFVDASPQQTPIEGGSWMLSEVIPWRDPNINDHACYESSAVVSDGSYTSRTAVSDAVCNWKYSESISFTGSWSSPPKTLIPGKSYPASGNISRSNPVEQWGVSDYIYLYMDNYETHCGYVTASKIEINTESIDVGWRESSPSSDSWAGNFEAPNFGYSGSSETKKFQIKAGGRSACIRYIYEWQE